MVAGKVFVKCYNFNLIFSKKVIVKVSYKAIRSRGWNWSRNAYLRLCGAGAEPEPKEINSAQQHWFFPQNSLCLENIWQEHRIRKFLKIWFFEGFFRAVAFAPEQIWSGVGGMWTGCWSGAGSSLSFQFWNGAHSPRTMFIWRGRLSTGYHRFFWSYLKRKKNYLIKKPEEYEAKL